MRDLVVEMLEQARRRFRFVVWGFVVMPEHVHLLVSESQRALLANAIQSLKIASSRRTSQQRLLDGRHSPLWQKRYYDRNLRSYAEFVEKLRYVHRNPVKRGLVEKPENWNWSSALHYATGDDCGVEIESRWTAPRRERSGKAPHLPAKDCAG
jgi:putative transposase